MQNPTKSNAENTGQQVKRSNRKNTSLKQGFLAQTNAI